MEDYDALKSSLISIAGELFRFRGVFLKMLARFPQEEQPKYWSQFSWFSKRVVKALDGAGLRIVDDLEGKEYDAGMAVTPINLDDYAPDDRLYIVQMMEPIIMEGSKVIKTGTVYLGRFQS